MKRWDLNEVVEFAKNNSPYYKNLYQETEYKKLSDLPIADSTTFWKSEVLTSKSPSGLVFKSGGSTGSPKHSYFTNEEWISFTAHFGWGMSQGLLAKNDRIANLFYVGDMYASFLFIKDSLQSIPTADLPLTQFPIGGVTKNDQILKTLNEFSINVVVGVPTALLVLFEEFSLCRSLYPNIKIDKILFGGEHLYPDQEAALKKIFPELAVASIGLASVDGGLLGFISPDCKSGEHRVFDGATIIEIVDPDTLEVITQKNRVGKVLLTNLTRKLMPIIRFPAGDMAMWMEEENRPSRKFSLQGRADEGARVGTMTVFFDEMRSLIQHCLPSQTGIQFQMILNHFDGLDELVILIAGHYSENDNSKLVQAFQREKRVYQECLLKKLIHPVKFDFIEMSQLETNSRTGKLKRIIDRR
jgi:phenylacetate-CoA ligase